jgi:molybdopterin converting factor small subunit
MGPDEQPTSTIPVQLEILPWLNRYYAGGQPGRVALELAVSDGATIRELLEVASAGDPQFKEMLWNAQTGRVAGHIAVILNGRLVELAGGLDAKLAPGDTVQLMPGFSGG